MMEQPWLLRPDWAARTVPNINRGSIFGALFLWGFALFWNGFLTLVLLMADRGNRGPSPAVLYAIVSPFALAGLFLLGLAITVTVTLIRYRSLQLRLDTLPGLVGGRMAGSVQGAEGVLRDGMSVRLACWRRYGSTDTSDDLLWEDVEDIPPESMFPSADDATVPFRFDVPWECEPTGDGARRIAWQLTVQTRGGAVAGVFDVPVYRTAESSPQADEKSLRPRNVAQPPYSKRRVEPAADGGIDVHFPTPTWLWKWYLFTFVIGAAAIVVARQQLPGLVAEGVEQSWVIATYGAIAAAVLFLLAIIQMGLFFAPRRLRAGRDGLRMRFQSAFRGPKTVPASDIAEVVVKYSNSTRKYDIDFQRTGGTVDPWMMISAVDKREAEWLAHELRAALR